MVGVESSGYLFFKALKGLNHSSAGQRPGINEQRE